MTEPVRVNDGVARYSKSVPEILTREVVEASADVIFLVDAELRITYCNPAWDRFALENGGERALAKFVVGTNLMTAVCGPMSRFYREALETCHRHGVVFDLDYECSSAEEYRLMHMTIFPLRKSGELAVVNSLRVQQPHGEARTVFSPESIYFNSYGLVTQCCHCRRSRRQDGSQVWDWVPEFLGAGPWEITHGMCPVCVSYFYSRYLPEGVGEGAS